jgi:hypothetical protein
MATATQVVELFSTPRELEQIRMELTKPNPEITLPEAALHINSIRPYNTRTKVAKKFHELMMDVMDDHNISVYERHPEVGSTLVAVLREHELFFTDEKTKENIVVSVEKDMGIIEFE